jgi:hypothetical protein
MLLPQVDDLSATSVRNRIISQDDGVASSAHGCYCCAYVFGLSDVDNLWFDLQRLRCQLRFLQLWRRPQGSPFHGDRQHH